MPFFFGGFVVDYYERISFDTHIGGMSPVTELIMVASGKGGVGKTTLSAGVASCLARRGRRVLLVEAACGFRSLDLLLGLPASTVFDLGDALEGRCSLGDAILVQEESQLRLIPAPGDPFYLPEEERLAAFFRWTQEHWDAVLVDCGPGFSPLDRMLARYCSKAVLVTTPKETAARCAARMSALLAREGLDWQRLVINRVPGDFRPTRSLRDLDDVIDLAGVQLLGAVPEHPGPLALGEDLPDDPASRALNAIARRILGERVELTLYP